MNLIKLSVSALVMLSAFSLQAQSAREIFSHPQVQEENAQTEKKPARTVASGLKTYGVYTLQPKLIALPQSLANRSTNGKELGSFTLVATKEANHAINEFRKNAVVQNSVTGELGVITGNLTLLLKDEVSIQQLEQQFDLRTIESAAETGVYIVMPNKEQNLVLIQQKLEASGLIKAARLDILEKKYSSQ